MADNNCSTRLSIERGAARIHISDSGSPTHLSPERTPSRHQAASTSHSGQDMSPFRWFLADSLHLLPSSMAGHQDFGVDSEASTEMADTVDIQYSFSEPTTPATSPETPGPFLSLPNSPERNGLGVWAFHPPVKPDFVIWEDSQSRLSPLRLPPMSFSDLGEDKENTYATLADYDTSDGEESTSNLVDYSRTDVSPRDIFGMPLDSQFGPPLTAITAGWRVADISNQDTIRHDIFNRSASTPIETIDRSNMRAVLRDEDIDEEWDDSLSMTQIRDLQDLRDIYAQGAEQGIDDDRYLPMRDNSFLGARRVTEYRRHQDRRIHEMEED